MIEQSILSSLVFDDDYARKVLPYLKKDYFTDLGDQVIFKLIRDFSLKYNKPPTVESLQIELDSCSLAEKPFESANEVLRKLQRSQVDQDWLVEQTEKFCQRQSLLLAITSASNLLIKNEYDKFGSVLTSVQDALSVSFDSKLGHDYFEDAEARFKAYQEKTGHLETDLAMINKITGGGFENRTLTVFIAPTNVGKSIMLCHLAAAFVALGKNVMFFTLEMGEGHDGISRRVDANLLDVDINMLKQTDPGGLKNRIDRLRMKNTGKLYVKQYPTSSAHSGHFRHFLNELKLKKGFKPDVIIVDYLNICASAKSVKGANSYENAKNIAEDLRGLGVEFDCRVITATQVNREGADSSDFGMTQTSESFGVPMTADYMFAMISTPALSQVGKMKIKQLKNRNNDKRADESFLVKIDYTRMRFSDDDSNVTLNEPEEELPQSNQERKGLNSRFEALMFSE